MIPGIASTFKNPCNTFWPQIGHYEPKTGHAVSDKLIWLCYRDLLSENPIQVPAGTEMNNKKITWSFLSDFDETNGNRFVLSL